MVSRDYHVTHVFVRLFGAFTHVTIVIVMRLSSVAEMLFVKSDVWRFSLPRWGRVCLGHVDHAPLVSHSVSRCISLEAMMGRVSRLLPYFRGECGDGGVTTCHGERYNNCILIV